MQRTLTAAAGAGTLHLVALTGLGGVGKSQTMLEYAWRHRNDYQVVWWMTAETPTALEKGFMDLARALRLPEVAGATRPGSFVRLAAYGLKAGFR